MRAATARDEPVIQRVSNLLDACCVAPAPGAATSRMRLICEFDLDTPVGWLRVTVKAAIL
jgi:hypothetical protein